MRASLNFTSGIRLYKTAQYHNEALTLKIKSEFEPYQKDHHRNKLPKEERIYLKILYIYYANENLYDIRFLMLYEYGYFTKVSKIFLDLIELRAAPLFHMSTKSPNYCQYAHKYKVPGLCPGHIKNILLEGWNCGVGVK